MAIALVFISYLLNFISNDIIVQKIESVEQAEKLKWENRLVIIFENEKSDEQINKFTQSRTEFRERDMKIVFVEKSYKKEFTGHYNGRIEHPAIYLIGKDGFLKFESDELVSDNIIYDIIDKMPMRKQEINLNQ